MKGFPRLPLEGSIDLTYRCNNNCRHCWLRIPPDSSEKGNELTAEEIRRVVDDARSMGCRRWCVSGGEPMLRPDFPEIFGYLTRRSVSYSINTNGTLITPQIAQLMKRKGTKMVALYGATAEVHDHITRNPGSFESTMQGFANLKEAGAGFVVQLVPMRDNVHQFKDMVSLAESLSPHWRIGATWLWLSASGDPERNTEIVGQRLDPKDVVEIDEPNISYEEAIESDQSQSYCGSKEHVFASCISRRRDFHIDPYGRMTFCSFIKDDRLRYDLRKGSFGECWEEFIPSLADRVEGSTEYRENCGSCELQKECRWCPVYGYLEHRRYSARVDYLCAVARELREYKEHWRKNHRRYYRMAGITVQVDSDLPFRHDTFHPKFKRFEVNGPQEDLVAISHHFGLPDLCGQDLGQEVYRRPPWAIYRKNRSWIYKEIPPVEGEPSAGRVVVCNANHTRATIYNRDEELFRRGGLHSLSFLPTDQILLARVLADKEGCYLHASGVVLGGEGLLFLGHSEAGKSTMVNLLRDRAKILCDDRMVVRRHPEGFRIHGTWSHGEVEEVSPDSARLRAIFFLEKSIENDLVPVENAQQIIGHLLACVVKPLVTVEWWDKTMALVGKMVREVPCYSLHFDKSGKVIDLLNTL